MTNDAQHKTGEGFSPRQMEVLGAVAREIIPASEAYGVPGADDAAILALIAEKAAGQRRRILAGIEALEQFALEDLKTGLTPENLPRVMESRRKELRSFTSAMMMITAQSYYQDPRVLESLGLPARPPFPMGHEIEDVDLAILDPVKQMAPRYRKV